ncbi:hypothetical protein BDC45DRAFT_507017 [Circinella umbellata]|nr:hypothetical protein BDC45DRAFT_507017 [Circinella umbellata]
MGGLRTVLMLDSLAFIYIISYLNAKIVFSLVYLWIRFKSIESYIQTRENTMLLCLAYIFCSHSSSPPPHCNGVRPLRRYNQP